ncbi:hypothetical protein SS50377_24912 [Spironucleus salmonicida]|uniref:Transmembrane protein n=1 Tax=Spironucleus salmonicida TaxID=348837 RepID=A0A9P8LRC4_9EUKA|nr:hypothetical protein SS50377_24912 [Spironucleus salmonicida]
MVYLFYIINQHILFKLIYNLAPLVYIMFKQPRVDIQVKRDLVILVIKMDEYPLNIWFKLVFKYIIEQQLQFLFTHLNTLKYQMYSYYLIFIIESYNKLFRIYNNILNLQRR